MIKHKGIAQKLLFALLAIALFCALFLDDIIILGAVIHGQGGGRFVPVFLICILIYIILFLALPALVNIAAGVWMLVRASKEEDPKSFRVFGAITVFHVLTFIILLLISVFLFSLLSAR